MTTLPGFCVSPRLLPLTIPLFVASVLSAQSPDQPGGHPDPQPGYILPPDPVADLFATDPNFATLNHISPDGAHFVIPLSTELSTLQEVGEETLRLGMLEIRAATDRPWHLDTYGLTGLRFYSLHERSFTDVALPDGVYISDLMWSPDADPALLAFLVHLDDATQVWIASPSDGWARPTVDTHIITSLGTSSRGQGTEPSRMLQWTPGDWLITLAVPSDRGAPPPAPALPSGPTIRHTRAAATPNRTMPFLLQDGHDGDLFEYYTRSQIVELVPGGPARPIGEPGMYESISLSPDGRHLIATRIDRPFTFINSYSGFPRVTEVLDIASGEVLATLGERELQEGRVEGRRMARAIGAGAPTGAGSRTCTGWLRRMTRPTVRTVPAETASCSFPHPSATATRWRLGVAITLSRRSPIPAMVATPSPRSRGTATTRSSTTRSIRRSTPPASRARWCRSTTPATRLPCPVSC